MSTDKEIITLFIGQCGVQVGSAVWELLCVEHNLLPNGRAADTIQDSTFNSFFQETMAGQYVPRSLFADLEPTCIDEIRVGSYRKLFHPDQLINSNEDAANNFARGIHTVGKSLYENALKNIRKLTDQCNNVSTFILNNSFGGGTGSGFGSGLMARLHNEYSKKAKFQIAITPAQSLSTAVVEPYNAILATHTPTEHVDVAILFDNEALYRICSKTLEMPHLTYCHINRILAQVFSCLTCCERFDGCLQSQLDQFQTNLVPYPKIHFPTANYCPIICQNRADHQSLSTFELSRRVFEKDSQLAMCNFDEGKFISCVMIYRGNVSPSDVNSAVLSMKKSKRMEFVEWCPTGFKIGVNSQSVTTLPSSGLAPTARSVTVFTNHTSIVDIFKRLTRKYDLLYSKKAFVWWYVGEGMEEGELFEAREGTASLEKDYEEIAVPGSSTATLPKSASHSSLRHVAEPEIAIPEAAIEFAHDMNKDKQKSSPSASAKGAAAGGLGVKKKRGSGSSKRSARSKNKKK